MSRFIAVYDACVLYPAVLRDLLMHMAMSHLYMARWTDRIHDEWINSLLKNRSDLTLDQLMVTRAKMDESVPDALVTGYEHVMTGLKLPDPNDRHVLAAAICCHANTIVTKNLRDFPQSYLNNFNIEAQHPDDFLVRQKDLSWRNFCIAIKNHRKSLRKYPKTVEEYLETLAAQGLPQTVSILREYSSLI